MNSEKTDRTEGPPLPPSPLAEVEPAPPDVPLPWSALPAAAAAGFLAGAIDSVLSRPTANWAVMYAVSPVSAAADQRILWGLGAGVVTLGAALADRVGSRWPRVARWACGMGLGAVVSPSALLTVPYLITTRAPAHFGFLASGLALMVLSRGLLGAVLGVGASARHGLLWKAPAAGLLTSVLTIVVYPVVRICLGLSPPPLDWPGRLGSCSS